MKLLADITQCCSREGIHSVSQCLLPTDLLCCNNYQPRGFSTLEVIFGEISISYVCWSLPAKTFEHRQRAVCELDANAFRGEPS